VPPEPALCVGVIPVLLPLIGPMTKC